MTATPEPIAVAPTVEQLPLADIKPDPDQPRKTFDDDYLHRLADDIAARGVLQPITVRPNGECYMIVFGECRWRASQLAKRSTIPALIEQSDRDPVDRLIDQVAENLQREDLAPMELAQFFDTLISQHGIKVKDIAGVLEQHGLKKMERSYISNMRRLLKLPDWAKTLIDTGKLTPSHGKIILMANGHDQVHAELQTKIESDFQLNRSAPTIAELQQMLGDAFGSVYRDVESWYHHDHRRAFDPKTCEDCKTCRQIRIDDWHTARYCFDEACYDKKQADATEAENKKQAQAVKKAAEARGEDPAEALTPAQESLKAGRIERTQQYLDNWLREVIREDLAGNQDARYKVLLWVGAGAPGNKQNGYYGHGVRHPDLHEDDSGIDLTLKENIHPQDLLTRIIEAALSSMDRDNIGRLAHYCEIVLDDYQVEREYLEIKSKQELIDSTPEAVRDAFDDWAKTCKRPTSEIIDGILARAAHYGVPADLVEYYNATADDTRDE